jgi:hypothetical protein
MTYLEYTNIVLQAINEVPMTSQQFAASRGLQQFAKESINRTYFDIVGEYQWPWMHSIDKVSEGEAQLSGEKAVPITDEWTVIPVDNPYKDAVDWSTIYYTDSIGVKVDLKHLSWEEYQDMQDYVDSRSTPQFIVQSADGRSMGLLPFPTDLTDFGKLFYRIWSRPSRFTFATDELPIPNSHYTVLVDGAIHHMWSFRGNVEQAQIAYARFEKGLKKMKQKYSNQSTRMRWV